MPPGAVRVPGSGDTRVHQQALRSLLGPVVLIAAVLAGCSGGSGLRPAPSASDPACTAALKALPATVLGEQRGGSPAAGAAAWGKPAIVMVCGLPELAPTTDPCLTVDGVDWVIQNDSGPFTFATFGRAPAIRVTVPTSYGRTQASAALVDLKPVAATLPRTPRSCVGN
jgi:hypothetical protein